MSEQDTAGEKVCANSKLVPVKDGEWAGWSIWTHDAFEQLAGPFYQRRDEDDAVVCAFRVERQHLNGGGFLHGGCMMTFADFALFAIGSKALGGSHGVTMNLSGDFLDAVREGQLVEARGEVTRGGGKTIYVRGIVSADGKPALSFTGIIRKITR